MISLIASGMLGLLSLILLVLALRPAGEPMAGRDRLESAGLDGGWVQFAFVSAAEPAAEPVRA